MEMHESLLWIQSQAALSSWAKDESKREFLDRLFGQLIMQKNNRGHKLILEMTRNLARQASFPDLQNWENSDIKIREAVESVNQLRKELSKLDGQIEDKKQSERLRKEAEQRRLKKVSSQHTLEKLNDPEIDLVLQKIITLTNQLRKITRKFRN